MKDKGYYERWLILQLGCNDNTIFANKPVGNSPEFMPLDMSLNNDKQLSISLHCAITLHLPDDDPRKFFYVNTEDDSVRDYAYCPGL